MTTIKAREDRGLSIIGKGIRLNNYLSIFVVTKVVIELFMTLLIVPKWINKCSIKMVKTTNSHFLKNGSL